MCEFDIIITTSKAIMQGRLTRFFLTSGKTVFAKVKLLQHGTFSKGSGDLVRELIFGEPKVF